MEPHYLPSSEEHFFRGSSNNPPAGLTAVIALYEHLKLPFPWSSASTAIPFIVYGASTAVGSFAIKLAARSNIHPIVGVAGKGAHYIQQFLDPSKGDRIVDYRNGPEQTIKDIKAHLQSLQTEVKHALDTVAIDDSVHVLRSVLSPGGNINFVLPNTRDVSPAVATNTWVSGAHGVGDTADSRDLCFLFCRWIGRGFQLGFFSGHPFEVRKGGLNGIEQAMKDLKDGKASAVKYVFRIAETEGL